MTKWVKTLGANNSMEKRIIKWWMTFDFRNFQVQALPQPSLKLGMLNGYRNIGNCIEKR